MQVLATQFTLSTSALEVYFAGCKGPHCHNCHNPESWSFEQGEILTPNELSNRLLLKLIESGDLIDKIMLFGGEPLDQPHDELEVFLRNLNGRIPVWLFTKYEIYDIPFTIRILCSYIKTGRYIPEFAINEYYSHGIKLATSNQKILRRGYDY